MQRYFFHIEYGELSHDAEGTPLPSLEAARAAAVTLLGELLRDAGDSFWEKPEISITVTDEAGLSLWRLEAMGQQSASVTQRRR